MLDYVGSTPLHIAVKCRRFEVAKLLLARKDIVPNLTGCYNRTPLHDAWDLGDVEMVTLILLLARRDVVANLTDHDFKSMLLQTAEICGDVELVRFLLAQNDVNLNLANHQHQTPLCPATSYGHVEIGKLLLARKDINLNPTNNLKALHVAVKSGQVTIVKLLLEQKDIPLNLKDDSERTPLYIVAERHHTKPGGFFWMYSTSFRSNCWPGQGKIAVRTSRCQSERGGSF